jgi:hypothetical protein
MKRNMKVGNLVEVNDFCQVRSLQGLRGIVIKIPQSVIDGTIEHNIFQVSVLLPSGGAIFNSADLEIIKDSCNSIHPMI